jgi:phosphopantetheine adenylyltransferase
MMSLGMDQVPTAAELDSSMEAIVVSEETVKGAWLINEGRKARGFTSLEVMQWLL